MSHRPRKRFGQHFLHDPGVLARIVAAVDPRPGERLVEIGPGQGALTRPLLERCGRLLVVELDRDLAAELASRDWGAAGKLEIHQGDALRFDFAALALPETPLRIVGNLPYNISTPLLFHLLEQAHAIRDLHVMLQREVVQRLAATPGSHDYGRLSVMVQYHCRVEPLFGVGPGAFRPPPRVDSAVVRLVPHTLPPVTVDDPARLAETVRRAFSQRRKTLRNSLSGWLEPSAMATAGVDPGARPETLDLAAFARLANAVIMPPSQRA